ncbi:chemotaxis protein CheB [Nonomuraea jiangxiensis]|uniref:protein-glutamate methylesterase n=1 Tax=Nonomuraea jiangxiensis TaxID=633440 RepID=A0A1G8SXN9_9ACTN|nr:chemotaxis protein CheB [Nonomuraea jiangxiensis]SDJ34007.1 two-component system, chemotaxis family, response regulator CheB [Nonomuraea jiangxiensis]
MRTAGRDVIVVAASAGGVEPLRTVLSGLPPDLPAALLVVLHVPPQSSSVLANILDRAGPLKAAPAENAEPVRPGRVYVARPDHHLLLHGGRTRLSRGPRQNGHRPAADPLFMSAALDAGPRAAAVVLSGTLDDGAKGCEVIDRYGGAVAVQDCAECAFPGMPRAAVSAVPDATILPVREIAAWIQQQSRTPVSTEDHVYNGDMEKEIALFLREVPALTDPDGDLIAFSCPECGGPIYEQEGAAAPRFICRVGHAWSRDSMIDAQSDSVERALWVAIQRLEERLRVLERMRRSAADRGQYLSSSYFQDEEQRTREAVETIRLLQSRIGRSGDTLLSG